MDSDDTERIINHMDVISIDLKRTADALIRIADALEKANEVTDQIRQGLPGSPVPSV